MGLHSHSNGGTIQRYQSSNIQKYQCFESWNPEKKNNRDTIHFNADASNTSLLFLVIHSGNQLDIYGAVSDWCEQFGLTEEEEKVQEKPWKERTRGQRYFDKREITRSKTFGIFAKTSIWQQCMGKYSGLLVTVRNKSLHKGLRRCIDLVQGIGWSELQNQT